MIVATEIESVHGEPPQQIVYYRCQDHVGEWHTYGPIVVNDSAFDIAAHELLIPARVEEQLAAQEFNAIVGGI